MVSRSHICIPNLPEEVFKTVMKMKPSVFVDLIIKDSHDRVLLGRRNTEPFKNYWQVIGGLIYYNETTVDAIKRIALRETGLIIENPILSDVYDFIDIDPRGHIVCLAYIISDYTGDLAINDYNTELKFFNINGLPSPMVSLQVKEIVDTFQIQRR